MSGQDLDVVYKQNLETNIIEYLAKVKHIDARQAMDIYYKSELSKQIQAGEYGMENLDYKYLVEDLIENEEQLFA